MLHTLSDKELDETIEYACQEWLSRNRNSNALGKVVLYDGTVVNLLSFKESDFNPEHCFNILPKINRYNGNTYIPFSVGSHSLLCYELCKVLFPEKKLEIFLCLTHDFIEALMGDFITPLKHLAPMSLFRLIEKELEEKMYRSLGVADQIGPEQKEKVKLIDKLALSIEIYNLNKYYNLDNWKPHVFSIDEIKSKFKLFFYEYTPSLLDNIIVLDDRQVEVKLRQAFNTAYKNL